YRPAHGAAVPGDPTVADHRGGADGRALLRRRAGVRARGVGGRLDRRPGDPRWHPTRRRERAGRLAHPHGHLDARLIVPPRVRRHRRVLLVARARARAHAAARHAERGRHGRRVGDVGRRHPHRADGLRARHRPHRRAHRSGGASAPRQGGRHARVHRGSARRPARALPGARLVTAPVQDAAVAPAPAARRGLALPSGRTWVDVVVLLVLTTLGVLGFAPSYGGYSFLLAGLGGLALGAVTGILTSMLRFGGLLTLAAAIVGYFALGPALAVPSQSIWGVVPTLQSLASLAIGTVFGWADLLTLSTPVGAPAYIAVVPFAASWLVALVSTVLATRWLAARPRTAWRFAIAVVPAFALYLTGILVGTSEAYQAGIRGAVFAVLVLVWLGWRRPVGGEAATAIGSLRTRKIVGTVLVVAVAIVAGGGAGFW